MFASAMWACVSLLLVFSTCIDANVAKTNRQKRNSCVYNEHTNGCRTPTGHKLYRKTFTPACNEHDVCYFCGTRYEISREQCDNEFKRKMYEICDSSKRSIWSTKNILSGNTCKATADLYYVAVDNFGSSYYEDPSPSWCEETCVRDLLDDYFNLAVRCKV